MACCLSARAATCSGRGHAVVSAVSRGEGLKFYPQHLPLAVTMKLHILIIVTTSCLLSVKTQNHGTVKAQQIETVNEGQIYFTDNRPTVSPDVSRIDGKTYVEVQKSLEPEEDSYAQAVLGNQGFSGVIYDSMIPTADAGSKLPQPNLNLQPPHFDENIHNYYSAYHDSNLAILRAEEATGLQVTSTPAPPKSLIANVSLSVIGFGINLLKNLERSTGNVVISPFSVAELLALLQQGALGVTQQQITDALQMPPQASVEAFKNINEHFQKRGNSLNILRVANNLFVADAFELSPAFKTVAMRSFGSEVTPTEFSNTPETVQKINQWVAQKTNNKIPELLSPDAVGDNTQMVMVNAVYFKGLWAVRFKPESTLSKDFYVNDVTKKSIPFMRIRKIFKAGLDPSNNAKIIILPFEKEQYSLMVVLPSPISTLEALISQLTDSQLTSYLALSPKEVDLEIPKFTIKADTNLNPVFRKMGISNVFTNQAELTGVGKFRSYSPQLSSALHSAMLSIDEDGGSAAAATSFAVVALSYDDPSFVFKANRPFLAILWDNESSLPLFMARVQDPATS